MQSIVAASTKKYTIYSHTSCRQQGTMLRLPNRGVIKIWGQDSAKFLHNITTNDVLQMAKAATIYNLLLNAKGRFLHDFFLIRCADHFFLECEDTSIASIIELVRLYRVHLRVKIRSCTEYLVAIDTSTRGRLLGETTTAENGIISFQDPRSLAMGMRYLIPASLGIALEDPSAQCVAEHNTLRIINTIPDCSVDMVRGESFALHFRLDKLNAICHAKGCYTGQEVTARMYRVGPKKMLYTVEAPGGQALPKAGTVLRKEKDVGKMLSTEGNIGLCLLSTEQGSAGCDGLHISGIALTLRRAD